MEEKWVGLLHLMVLKVKSDDIKYIEWSLH